jgi:hypothetical protein
VRGLIAPLPTAVEIIVAAPLRIDHSGCDHPTSRKVGSIRSAQWHCLFVYEFGGVLESGMISRSSAVHCEDLVAGRMPDGSGC